MFRDLGFMVFGYLGISGFRALRAFRFSVLRFWGFRASKF